MVTVDSSTRRLRPGLRAATVAALAVALAVAGVMTVGAGSAQAATGAWGTFTVAGSARAYSGTMTLPGFPATTYTSTSRQATVVSGSSTWQAASTPPGAVYGTSQGTTYLNQRPNVDTPSVAAVTTYTFQTPTPAGGWSFVLGDIDADQATISATAADGSPVSVDDLGFAGVYNYCHRAGGPSCDSANLDDVPSWNPQTATLTGNAAGADTEGATGWFSPRVPLATLTITYAQRKGLPVYQTWFAKTTLASGTVTVNGRPYGGDTVTIADGTGTTVATTTTAGDGTWSVAGLDTTGTYTATVATPPEGTPQDAVRFDVRATTTTGLDVDFTIPPVAITTTVTTADGEPAAGLPLVITRDGDTEPTATVTTGADGSFTADLLPSQTYTAVLDGAADQPIPLTTGTTPGEPASGPLVQPAAPGTPTPPVPPTQPGPPTSTPGTSVAPVTPAAATPELAATGSTPGPAALSGILVAGLGLVLVGLARRRSAR